MMIRTLSRSFPAAALVALRLVLPSLLTAQAAAAPPSGAPAAEAPQSIFGEQIEVRVVNVEVVVTDRSGNRVPDLQPRDFQIKVDGKVTPIEYFTEVRGGQAIAPAAGEQPPLPGLPSLAPGSPVGTSYLVFVDDYFSTQIRRNEVLKSLKDDLTRLGPEDRMAIVAFDGRHLQMLSSWTSSQHDLARAIDREIGTPPHGLERLAELNSYDSTRRLTRRFDRSAFPSVAATDLNAEELGYAARLNQQISRMIAAAVSTMRSFAAPPGRKVMLLLSGGWPFSIPEYVVDNPARPVMTAHQVPTGEQLMAPLTSTANRLGFTVYPVDVPGIQTAAASAATNFPGRPLGFIDLREQEEKGSLNWIAGATGGKPLLNSLRLAALREAEGDTRAYYWLGFTPSWKGNDKQHRIQVEALRPGLKVRSRDNFLDLSRKAEISMMVESAMLFGSPPGSAQMLVRLGPPVKSGRHEVEVPVTLDIPTDAITMVPINGKYASEIELRVAALDDSGERSDIPVVPIQLSSQEPPAKGKFVRYDTKLKLRKTKQHVTFAVFDPLSNHIAMAETDVKF
jgi:VWFA-related protein